jgi:hypothetical protein
MRRVKGEPGIYIPYEKVEGMLTNGVYGAIDLVKIGLFYSEHFVREAMSSGKLKHCKINKRAVSIRKEDVLEYWKKYRNKPYETVNNVIDFKVTISEVDYLGSLISFGRTRFCASLQLQDFFRNVLRCLRTGKIELLPELFEKHS